MYKLHFILVAAAIVTSAVFIASCQDNNPAEVKTFTVLFNSNGGTSVESQTVWEGKRALKPTDPIKIGSIFEGWYKEATLTNEWLFDTDVVTFSFTLFAKWTVIEENSFTVTFESNGGSSVASRSVKEGDKTQRPFPDPTKAGNLFEGWFKEATLTDEWLFNIDIVTSNITLYAKWTPFDGITIPFETRNDVLKFLKYNVNDGNILFGKHLEFRRGMGEDKQVWYNNDIHTTGPPTRSDTYRITNKYPAVLGMDVYEPFQRGQNAEIRSMVSTIKMFAGSMNGLIAISSHIENPWWDLRGRQDASYRYKDPNNLRVVRQILELDGPVTLKQGYTVKQFFDEKVDQAIDALLEMTLPNGKQIPLMVRLFHENSREFFWWGDQYCTPQEYIALYRYTANRMKARINNLMFVYAPDRNWFTMNPTDKYMDRYPGDDYVDILGYDDYFILDANVWNQSGGFRNGLDDAITRLKALSQYAQMNDKVVILAETGLMQPGGLVTYNKWFTDHLFKAITTAGVNLSYFLIWNPWPSDDDSGTIFPYMNNSPAADNLRDFVSRDRIKMNDFMMAQ